MLWVVVEEWALCTLTHILWVLLSLVIEIHRRVRGEKRGEIMSALVLLQSVLSRYLSSMSTFDFSDRIQCLFGSSPEPSQSPYDRLVAQNLKLIRDRQWSQTLAWIAFHPDQLTLLDARKQTVLHHLSLFRAPCDVLDLLLYQAPHLAAQSNEDGEVPLHWLVRVSADLERMELILRKAPPSGVRAFDRAGQTPLSLLWDRYDRIVWSDEATRSVEKTPGWQRILLLIRADYNHRHGLDFETPLEYPLHAACECPCPPSLFRTMMRLYFDLEHTLDASGRLPLMAACLEEASSAPRRWSKISMLVDPKAVRHRDDHGLLPVQMALVSGFAWDEGVEELLDLYNEPLQQLDRKQGLPLFALPAMARTEGGHCSGGTGRSLWDTDEQLTTIFQVLRRDPSALASCRRHDSTSRPSTRV